MAQRTVAVNFVANTAGYTAGVGKASAATGLLGTRAGGASKGLTGMAKAALGPTLALAGPAGLVMGMTKAIKSSLAFEDEMMKLRTQIGLTSAEVDGMRVAAMSLGGATTKGPQELAEATFFIASAGLRGAAALDVLKSSARLSAIGMGETKVVADLLTSAVNAYGEESLSAALASDVLVNAVRLGKASADSLAGSLGKVLPIAAAMGVTFDEVGGIVAAMTKTGTDATMATTQLRAMMVSILKPANEAEEAMAGMGLSSERLRAVIQEDGLWAALMMMREATGGNADAYAELFPNVRALAGVMDLLGPMLEGNAELMAEMADSTGVAGEAFIEFATGTRAELDKLSADWDRMFISMGDRSDGFVHGFAKGTRGIVQSVGDMFESNEDRAVFVERRMREANDAMREMQRLTSGLSGTQLDAARDSAEYVYNLDLLDESLDRLGYRTSVAILGVDLYRNQSDAARGSVELMTDELAELLAAYVRNHGGIEGSTALLGSWERALEGGTDAVDDQALELSLLNEAMAQHVQGLDDARAAQQRAVDPMLNLFAAQQDVVDALDLLNGLQAEGKVGTLEYQEAVLGLLDAEGDLQYALGQSGLTFSEFTNNFLNPAIERLGLTDEAAADLRASFAGLGEGLDTVEFGPFMLDMQRMITVNEDLRGAFDESGMSVDQFKTDVLLRLKEAGDISGAEFGNMLREVNGYRDDVDDAKASVEEFAAAIIEIDGTATTSSHVHTITTVTQGSFEGPARVVDAGRLEFRAAGGPVRAGQPYVVGEEGPEIMVPEVAGTVLNAQQTAGALSGGKGISIGTYNTYRGVDDDALLRRLEWAQEVGRL